MKQFGNVIREYTTWMRSFSLISMILPYHLYVLFGGVGFLWIYDILRQFDKYFSILYTIGYYAFFLGIILTLAAPNKKYLPYALWGYVLFLLFPFTSFTLYTVIKAAFYILCGYFFMRYEATEEGQVASR